MNQKSTCQCLHYQLLVGKCRVYGISPFWSLELEMKIVHLFNWHYYTARMKVHIYIILISQTLLSSVPNLDKNFNLEYTVIITNKK